MAEVTEAVVDLSGVCAFDLETDRLLDKTRSNFGELRITAGVGVTFTHPTPPRVREGGVRTRARARREAEEGSPGDWFHVLLTPGTEPDEERAQLDAFGARLDAAQVVVAYNGRGFDLRVLRNYFDSTRVDAWAAKLLDPFEVIRNATGAWVKLDHLLAVNGLARKTADGVAAVDWWAQGRHDEVLRYCRSDVELLVALLQRPTIRFRANHKTSSWGRGSPAAPSRHKLYWSERLSAFRGSAPRLPQITSMVV